MKKSDNITIQKDKPEFTNLKWFSIMDPNDKDSKEEEINETIYGKRIKLKADVKNLDDKDIVILKIYEKGYKDNDDYKDRYTLEVKESKIEIEWKTECGRQRLEELSENDKLEYIFKLEWHGIVSDESNILEIGFIMDVEFLFSGDEYTSENEYTLESNNGNYKKTLTTKDDRTTGDNKMSLRFDKIIPGLKYTLKIKFKESDEREPIIYFKDYLFIDIIENK